MNKELKPYSILFIEDEQDILKKFVKHLKNHYTTVYSATNAEDGFVIYKEKKPDIMIVDIHLPQMSGLDFIKIIREKDLSTKIIILSAHNDIDYLLQANSLKLTDYLVKPITRSSLHKTLNKAIQEKQDFLIRSIKKLQLKENFIWNYAQSELYQADRLVKLSPREIKILTLFFNNLDTPLSYDIISSNICDISESKSINAIKIIVKTLRKKLPKNTILNVYGVGYKILS